MVPADKIAEAVIGPKADTEPDTITLPDKEVDPVTFRAPDTNKL